MKIRLKFAFVCLGLALSTLAANRLQAAPEPGLYHCFDPDSGKTVGFLRIPSSGKAAVYGDDWDRSKTEVFIEGDSVKFKYRIPGIEVDFKGAWNGNSFSGTWHRFAVQFTIEGPWKSVKIPVKDDWTPWGFTNERTKGVLDMTSRLVEKAPFQSYAEFQKVWANEIEPKYYALISALYLREVPQGDLAPLREAVARRMYAAVTKGGVGLKQVAAELPDGVREAIRGIRSTFSWKEDFGFIVSMPLGDLDYERITVESGTRQFTMVGSDWVAAHLKRSSPAEKYFYGQALLYALQGNVNYLGEGKTDFFVGRGAAAYLSGMLKYSNSPADYLGFDPKDFDTFVQGWEENKRRVAQADMEELARIFSGEKRPESYFLVYQLICFLLKEKKPEELFNLDFANATNAANAFFVKKDLELQSGE